MTAYEVKPYQDDPLLENGRDKRMIEFAKRNLWIFLRKKPHFLSLLATS
jgi:hypothetical protein